MREIILLLLVAFTTLNSSAQLKKTLVIDTLVGYETHNQLITPLIQQIPIKGKELVIDPSFKPNIYVSKNYPNIIVTDLEQNDIAILLDNKGGVLKLLSLNNTSGDTIKIDKWKIYQNGVTDTIRVTKAYFQMYNDSSGREPYKTQQILQFEHNTGKKELKTLDLTINDKHYRVNAETISLKQVFPTTFQGYFPKRKYRKYANRKDENNHIHKYKMFMGEKTEYIQRFNATLEL